MRKFFAIFLNGLLELGCGTGKTRNTTCRLWQQDWKNAPARSRFNFFSDEDRYRQVVPRKITPVLDDTCAVGD